MDHNPTSTKAITSFHGASISLFQHEPSKGKRKTWDIKKQSTVNKISDLPSSYTNLKPWSMKHLKPLPIGKSSRAPDIPKATAICLKQEYEWLQRMNVTTNIDDCEDKNDQRTSNLNREGENLKLTCLYFSVFSCSQYCDNQACHRHKVRDTTFFLNPAQIPVIIADQPFLFASTKQIQ